jgi:hypothetical protein
MINYRISSAGYGLIKKEPNYDRAGSINTRIEKVSATKKNY